MVTIRTIGADELDTWVEFGSGDPSNERVAGRVRSGWAEDSGGPELTFVAEDDAGAPVGRLAFLHGPVASSKQAVHEAVATGLWLRWDDPDAVEIGSRLVLESLPALPPSVIAIDGYANPDYVAASDVRQRVFEAAGLPILQEKEGVLWTPATSPTPDGDPRLTFRTIAEAGSDLYARTMSRCTEGTLDRQDRYYAGLVGRDGWGPEMLSFLEDEDAPTWLLAFDGAGEVAGYMALGTFDEPTRGTIIHIGVVPEFRGRRYIDELLRACNEAALGRGFDRVLSDVDVENGPMLAAMERAGHLASATAWHVHHYRLELRR